MAHNMENTPSGAKVTISLFNLFVEVEQLGVYPDQIQDMANRAVFLFNSAIETCKINQLDIRELDLEEEED